MSERAKGFAWVALAYVVAIAAGYAAAWSARAYEPWVVLAAGYGASVVAVFVFSFASGNSSFFDAWWMVAPVAVLPWFVKGSGNDARQLLIDVLVLAWAVRLTWNWVRGWHGLGQEDWRYVELKQKSGRAYWLVSFLAIHAFPGLLVYLGSLSLIVALPSPEPLGALDLLAAAVTLGAIAIEAIADQQLHAYAKSSPPKGSIADVGLWRHSRHPNYFGEMGFWTGLFLFAIAADPDRGTLAIAGPVSIVALFVFGTIPMMERRQLERRKEAYEAYRRKVSMVVPWFRRE